MSDEQHNATPQGAKDSTTNCHNDLIGSMLKYLPLIEYLIDDIKGSETYSECLDFLETLCSILNRQEEANGYSEKVLKKLKLCLDSLCDDTYDGGEPTSTSNWSLEKLLARLKDAKVANAEDKNFLTYLFESLVNIIEEAEDEDDEENETADKSPENEAKATTSIDLLDDTGTDSAETPPGQEHILPDDVEERRIEFENQAQPVNPMTTVHYALLSDDEDDDVIERLDPLAAVAVVSNAAENPENVVVLVEDSSDEDAAEDDVYIIETRNSPICLDTDDDEDESEPYLSQEAQRPASAESSTFESLSLARPTIRTELATTGGNFSYLANVPSIVTPRQHLMDCIEISDSDSDSEDVCTEEDIRKRDFLAAIQLMPLQAVRKIARRKQTSKKQRSPNASVLNNGPMKEIAARDWLKELCEKFASPQAFVRTETQVLLHQVLTAPIFECLLKRRYQLNSKGWHHTDDKIKTFLRSVFFTNDQMEHLTEAGWRMWHFKNVGVLEMHGVANSSSTFTGMSHITSGPAGASSRVRARKKDDDEYTPPAQANDADGNTVRRSLRQNRKRSFDNTFTYNEDLNQPDFEEEARALEAAAVQRKVDQKRQEAVQRSKERAKSFERYFMGNAEPEAEEPS